MVRVKVYSQLTLDAETIRRELPFADVAPPIRRDDVPKDVAAGYNVIVIIDGRFHQELSVACDEIMDAMRAGVVVFGSSSMGAMRAAELYPYGMRGHGAVFEWIKNSEEFRDDLVAQVFSEDGSNVVGLSMAYVDLHFNLVEMTRTGQISEATFEAVTSTARALHYTERTPAGLRAALQTLGETEEEVLSATSRSLAFGSQKQRDALGLLAEVRLYLERVRKLNERLNGAA
jgi:hypothetical protein